MLGTLLYHFAFHAMKYAAMPVRKEMEQSILLERFQMVHARPVPLCLLKNWIVTFHLQENSQYSFSTLKERFLFDRLCSLPRRREAMC